VLGASTEIAFHSLCVMPQLLQQNRRRSPIVRSDQGSESIDDSSMKPSQTGHGRLNCTTLISWSDIWGRRSSIYGTLTIRHYRRIVPGPEYRLFFPNGSDFE
jgi:hypothetical protein